MADGGWWVQVSFASGGGDSMQLIDSGIELSGSRPIDGTDINSDGRDEFFATVGAGASSQIIGLFDVPGCFIRRVSINGFDAAFIVNGGLNFTSGIGCSDTNGDGLNDVLLTFDGQRIGSSSDFSVDTIGYSLASGQLTQVSAVNQVINVADPQFSNIGRLVCGPVTWS